MLPEQQQRIMGYFIEEAKDHLNTIEQGLLNLQTTIQDGEKANELFRAAHSVKGGAAMLGLESIQRTAHRMEDYFKVLKESPVQVDRVLETMFLRISDGLKDLLEQLEGPFGLTPDKAQEIMTDVEPVFEQLEKHLESLVDASSMTAVGGDGTQFASGVASAASDDALHNSFKRDVATLLRQLLTTFKHEDNLESRKTLQNTCGELIAIGEQFELTEWCDLVETARIAVGELSNDYRKLAPILIKEIKKAQEMVLTGRASEVAVSDAMQALLPEDLLSDGFSPASVEPSASAEIDRTDIAETSIDQNSQKSSATETEQNGLTDLFGEIDDDAGLFDSSVEDDSFEGLFDDPIASSSTDALAENTTGDAGNSELDPVNRLSVDLEFDEIPSELSALNRNAESEEKADESLDALLATVNVTGPDVGSEELNSLADLFDGDLDELDNTLGNHAFVSEEMRLNPESIEPAAEEDLTDLFGEDASAEEAIPTTEEKELDEDLFGGTLTNEEFVTLDDSFIDNDELEALSVSAEGTEETVSESRDDDASRGQAAKELEDPWADASLFDNTGLETNADVEAAVSESTQSLELSNILDSSSDSRELTEDVWAEEALLEEQKIASSSTQTDDELELENLSFESADNNGLTELSIEGSLNDLDLDSLDLESETGSFLDAGTSTAVVAETPTADEQRISADAKLTDSPTTPSLTEKLIQEQAITPREADIEFPTLTGEKLQEAEEDIDNFFVGDTDGDETAAGSAEDLLNEDDSWSDLSPELSTTENSFDESFSLDFGDGEDESEQQPELATSSKTEALETETQRNLDDGVQLEATLNSLDEGGLATTLHIEEAGSELDLLLEDAATSVSNDDSDVDGTSDDLWGELEAASDLLEEQTAQDDDLDFSFSTENEESSSVDSEADKLNDIAVEGVLVSEDIFSEEMLEEEPSSLDSTLENDFLTVESMGDRTQDPRPSDTNRLPSLSEDDLLDFDTAFGIEAEVSDETSTDEIISENPNDGIVEAQDLPTFSGDLDEFADAADGETTISDIAHLRLADAELDSLLGLDFAIDANERKRKELLESGEQSDESIDSSVIEAFSDVDELFEESAPSAESGDLLKVAEVQLDNTDGSDFFDSLGEGANDEGAAASDFSDFDELDSLLSEGIEESTDLVEPPTITSTFTGAATGTESKTADEEDFDDLERLLEEGEGDSTETPTRRTAARAPRRSTSAREQNMRVSVKHLDNLSNLVGELVVSRNTLERDQERLRQFLDNLLFQVQQLNDVGQRLRDLYERSLLESSLMSNKRTASADSSIEAEETDHATGATFDALEMDRFTGFHSLSQEMIELIVRVRESSSDIGYTVESSDQVTRQFRQITTQLQEGLNTARMVAFSQAADRLPRAVRDISLKCGKEARLVVEGQDTLIDKMIVEHLYDPLTHLVNNAITHGIEMPEARTNAGKSSEGTITVRAFYQGNQTVIYVSDDGGGINTQFVRRKAIEKGLISQEEAEGLSDIETYDLLFHPGFSTRDQADDFAGRGVGMDVVRTSLAEIRGSITIDSELGRGTSFTIRLPLTLSISKALSCVSNQARIAFPMDGVEDMLDVPRDRVVQNDQGQDCVRWRDALLPFQPVTELLKFNRTLGRGRVYGGSQEDDILSVIVLRSANTYVAVQVDQVIGEEEIVIKQLEGPVPKPLGIAGATVLGDGRVMPIADVLELIDIAMGRVRREPSSMMWAQEETATVEESPVKSEPTVLIVDDSITVRELLSMSFNKVGYRVEQARDGQEAWDKLRSGLPCDLVFCDIEMPRMDGLELLSRMQKDSQLRRVPIAMLTSRGADRHRQMAVDLGASGYFTKPYLEEALLDAAQRMLNGETLEKGRGG